MMDWSLILSEALKACLIACVPVLLPLLAKLIFAAFEFIEAHTSNQWLLRLEMEAQTVVMALWETVSKGIKEDLSDGKITQEEATSRLQKVKVDAIAILKNWLSGIPAKFRPILESKLSEFIESSLGKLKLAGKAGGSAGLDALGGKLDALLNPQKSPVSK